MAVEEPEQERCQVVGGAHRAETVQQRGFVAFFFGEVEQRELALRTLRRIGLVRNSRVSSAQRPIVNSSVTPRLPHQRQPRPSS